VEGQSVSGEAVVIAIEEQGGLADVGERPGEGEGVTGQSVPGRRVDSEAELGVSQRGPGQKQAQTEQSKRGLHGRGPPGWKGVDGSRHRRLPPDGRLRRDYLDRLRQRESEAAAERAAPVFPLDPHHHLLTGSSFLSGEGGSERLGLPVGQLCCPWIWSGPPS